MLGQGEFAARAAQTIDDLDGHDVGGPDRFLALGHVAVDDLVEVQGVPQPAGQPDIAEAAGIGPAHRAQADADDVGIIGQRDGVVVGKEAELLRLALAVVEDDGALPASFLVVVEFAEVGDARSPSLDEGVLSGCAQSAMSGLGRRAQAAAPGCLPNPRTIKDLPAPPRLRALPRAAHGPAG